MEPHEIAGKETRCIARALAIVFAANEGEWEHYLSEAVTFQKALKQVRHSEAKRPDEQMIEARIDHLKHMVEVRPDGLDKDAAVWALAEIARLNIIIDALASRPNSPTPEDIAMGIKIAKYGTGPHSL